MFWKRLKSPYIHLGMLAVNIGAGKIGRQGCDMLRAFGKLIKPLINLGQIHRCSLALAVAKWKNSRILLETRDAQILFGQKL